LASRSEEELRKLTVELRLLEQTADAVQSRINMINAVMTDLAYANMALEGLEKEEENAELLVPIGGNSYIKARLENKDKLIVGIGAGVSVEKMLPETKEVMNKRLEELEKTRASLQMQFTQVVDTIKEKRDTLNALVAQIQEGKTS
jgi:prefoldin alpha subunit